GCQAPVVPTASRWRGWPPLPEGDKLAASRVRTPQITAAPWWRFVPALTGPPRRGRATDRPKPPLLPGRAQGSAARPPRARPSVELERCGTFAIAAALSWTMGCGAATEGRWDTASDEPLKVRSGRPGTSDDAPG